jgi:mono/diheme cytochrome c family protein
MTGRRQVLVVTGAGVLLVGVGVWGTHRGTTTPSVRVPELSPAGQVGRAAFQRSCASCHGDVAQGTATGPPLEVGQIMRFVRELQRVNGID